MRQVAQPSASKPWRVRGIAVSLVLPLFALVAPAAAAPRATSDHGPLRVCASCAYTGVSEALSAALEREGQDMITVEAGQYRDPITISSDVRLRGAGAAETTLGYITIEAGVEASLADVTVTGRPGATTFGDRSGIDNSGDLTLRDSRRDPQFCPLHERCLRRHNESRLRRFVSPKFHGVRQPARGSGRCRHL